MISGFFMSPVICLPQAIISVNLASETTGTSAIDGDETFGVPALNTVVGNWNNLPGAAQNLNWDDGTSNTVGIDLNQPNGTSFFGAGYINTPMNFGLDHYLGSSDEPGTAIVAYNLSPNFPGGYYVIAYLTGFIKNTDALATDGIRTFYYQTPNPAPASFTVDDLVETTVTTDPGAGNAPFAQYAVFGSVDEPLTAGDITIRVDALFGGGVGIGGLQIVAVDGGGGGGGGVVDPNQTVFYLDAINGDNDNNGATPETPWRTLSKLDQVIFKPGDQAFFKRGDVFTGSFTLRGSGTSAEPVIFGAYGEGSKPRLEGGPDDLQVITIGDSGGLEFKDLEFSNNYPSGSIADRYGIRIFISNGAGEIADLHFHDLDFIDIVGSGTDHESRAIDADTGREDSARPLTRWNGFVVENCYFENIDGRAIQLNDRLHSLTDQKVRGLEYFPTVGFVVQNNTSKNTYRNFCQTGGTKGTLIQHNYAEGTTEGSAFWPFDTDGTVVQFNDFRHIRKAGADAYVCHFDFNCIDSVMQYNFGYDVQGGLIQVIVNSEFDGFQENAVARYNVGVDVGWRTKTNGAGIFFTGRVTGSKVYNNTVLSTNLYPSYKALSVKDWGGEWPDNNAMHNNLFLATGSPSGFENAFRMAQLGNVVSHNLYYGNMNAPTVDQAPVTGDPMIANPASLDPADLKVTLGSAAIGAGLIIPNNGGRDYFNNPVPGDATPTIGFHEFQTDNGTWAGYPIGATGYVDTGSGFLGWMWVGDDGAGVSGWMFHVATGQWVYLPEELMAPGSGAWFYIYDIGFLNPIDIRGEWFFAQALETWVFSTGQSVNSGSVWIYALDLSAFQN